MVIKLQIYEKQKARREKETRQLAQLASNTLRALPELTVNEELEMVDLQEKQPDQ